MGLGQSKEDGSEKSDTESVESEDVPSLSEQEAMEEIKRYKSYVGLAIKVGKIAVFALSSWLSTKLFLRILRNCSQH